MLNATKATAVATKAAAKPTKAAAKPVQPKASEADGQRAERQAEIDAMRATAARFYNGASLAAHKAKPAKRDEYKARAISPVQRPAGGNPSARDESGLALLLSKSDNGGTFCPVACAFDLGILSRLAAINLVAYDSASDSFKLTESGMQRARNIVKKAA